MKDLIGVIQESPGLELPGFLLENVSTASVNEAFAGNAEGCNETCAEFQDVGKYTSRAPLKKGRELAEDLIEACKNQDMVAVRLKLKQEADPNYLNSNGLRPLMIATNRRNEEMVKILLNHGADVDAKGNGGHTALFYAVMMNNLNLVKILIAQCKDTEAVNSAKHTILMIACLRGHAGVVDELKDKVSTDYMFQDGKIRADLIAPTDPAKVGIRAYIIRTLEEYYQSRSTSPILK